MSDHASTQCSFCERSATTYVDDECDLMPSCKPCFDAWQSNPGFTTPQERRESRTAITRATGEAQ